MAGLRSQIFRQVKQAEEARVNPLLTRFVTHDGKDASKCAAKALAMNCAVLPKLSCVFFNNYSATGR